MLALNRYVGAGGLLEPILRVRVEAASNPAAEDVPAILGRHAVFEDGLRFEPWFPFQQGLSYSAIYDPRAFGLLGSAEVLSLSFAMLAGPEASPPAVERIFPSDGCVPENLLRFYVCFSMPMQRGSAQAEIAVLDRDGAPVHDVLYQAPVELWDPSMRVLTVLLDPGRLKRGVGPNRLLGPPLKTGQEYALAVGKGMTGMSGRRLPEAVLKRFRVAEAVREAVDPMQWRIVPPGAGSRQALVVTAPRSLDWAMLSNSVSVETARGHPVEGAIMVGLCETEWSFAPTSAWKAGRYHVRVALELEDVCGNSVVAAFDRPLQAGGVRPDPLEFATISFDLD